MTLIIKNVEKKRYNIHFETKTQWKDNETLLSLKFSNFVKFDLSACEWILTCFYKINPWRIRFGLLFKNLFKKKKKKFLFTAVCLFYSYGCLIFEVKKKKMVE